MMILIDIFYYKIYAACPISAQDHKPEKIFGA
jgi:hypothetical protein